MKRAKGDSLKKLCLYAIAIVAMIPLVLLLLARIFIIDNSEYDCAEGVGTLCANGKCPNEATVETRGEFQMTANLIKRNMKYTVMKTDGFPFTAKAENRWKHFLKNPDMYSITATDMYPGLIGVDFDDNEDWSLFKYIFGSGPRDRASLLVALLKLGEADPPPPLPSFLHHYFMGVLDRIPSALDAYSMAYQQQRSTCFRFLRTTPLCNPKEKMKQIEELKNMASNSKEDCLNYEAELMATANQGIFTGDNSRAIEQLDTLCYHSCARPHRNCSDIAEADQDTKIEYMIRRLMTLAHFRKGEVDNCIQRHTGESCILPIRNSGQHVDTSGASTALEWLERELVIYPNDQHSKFFVNLAHMQLGTYPNGVTKSGSTPYPPFSEQHPIIDQKFLNLAKPLGLDYFGITGANAADDFFGTGYMDVIIGSIVQWPDGPHTTTFKQNRGDGSGFVDISHATNLSQMTNVWNIKQADYDNDGDLDLYITRGGWASVFQLPNSLLRNDGTYFTEVTRAAGVMSQQGSHSAEWQDFDLDGYLDLYVGNEQNPCLLWHNRGDGTFEDWTAKAGVGKCGIAKGVTWSDVNSDGWPDIIVSQFGGKNMIYQNPGLKGGRFEEVGSKMGITTHGPRNSFPVVSVDFNNDGFEDIFFAGHRAPDPGEVYAHIAGEKWNEAEILERRFKGESVGMSQVYLNNGNGTYTHTEQPAFYEWGTMGFNIGDIDNDGFTDVYLGTGQPDMRALIPNVFLRNLGSAASSNDIKFEDVTYAGGFGHLQKGHAITFFDANNDGHLDILANVGGAFVGDAVPDAAFINPGIAPKNKWLKISLRGVKSNYNGKGARIHIIVQDKNKKTRSIYTTQGNSGSFGSNPVSVQHIGLGLSQRIESISIKWPHKDLVLEPQVFSGASIPLNSWIVITEGQQNILTKPLNTYKFDVGELKAQDEHMGCSHHDHHSEEENNFAGPAGWMM